MNIEKLKTIIDDPVMTDDQLSICLEQAKKMAKNHHFWKDTDIPTDAELERFYDRYEYEIYAIAKAMNAAGARDGEIRHEELGIVRVWEDSGKKSSETALGMIPPKTYIV